MDYFPLSIATGKAFCNRKQELSQLEYNFKEARPTLIISPRRYGKTSLVFNGIQKLDYKYAQFDFLAATNESDFEKIMLKSVGELINQLEKWPQKAFKLATELFSGLSVKLSLDKIGVALEINQRTKSTTNILNILDRLKKLSKNYKKK